MGTAGRAGMIKGTSIRRARHFRLAAHKRTRAAVLYRRDLRLGAEGVVPIRVRPLFFALAMPASQICTRRRLNVGRFGPVREKRLVTAPVVAPRDRLHDRIRVQRRAIRGAQTPARTTTALGIWWRGRRLAELTRRRYGAME